MPRKRKRAAQQREVDAAPKPPPKVATALGAVLKNAGVTAQPQGKQKIAAQAPVTLAPPGPPPLVPVTVRPESTRELNMTELRLLNDAYEGTRPLASQKTRAKPLAERDVTRRDRGRIAAASSRDRADELAARTRLAALVSEGVRFKIRREDDYVEGLRADTSPKLLSRLQGKGFAPEATLDLHGLRVNQVGPALEKFARSQQRRGARNVLLIVGKGLHSEDGMSALAPAAIEALTQGLAAPWVIAFSTAHAVHGGAGALAVLLRD